MAANMFGTWAHMVAYMAPKPAPSSRLELFEALTFELSFPAAETLVHTRELPSLAGPGSAPFVMVGLLHSSFLSPSRPTG